MEAKAGLPLAWISVCSDCLASDRFECFDEFGERDRQAFLLLGPETLERIADVQAGPALVPRLGFQTLAERLLEEQEIIRHELEQALNQMRTLSRRREEYAGEWLPEPLLTSPMSRRTLNGPTRD